MKILLTLFVVYALEAHADEFFTMQSGPDPTHLVPSEFSGGNHSDRVSKLLEVTPGDVCMTSVPSFGAETHLSVYQHQSNEALKAAGGFPSRVPEAERRYMITVTKASESISEQISNDDGKTPQKPIQVRRHDREISKTLAIAAQRVWAHMLLLTRYPAYDSRGVDGVTYQFFVWIDGFGPLRGEAWSPKQGPVRKFVDLGQQLEEFVVERKGTEKELIDACNAFEKSLPAVDAPMPPAKPLPADK